METEWESVSSRQGDQYGRDVYVQIPNPARKPPWFITMKENLSVKTKGVDIKVKMFWHPKRTVWHQCLQLTIKPTRKGNMVDQKHSFPLKYVHVRFNRNISTIWAEAIISSEENSYGVALSRWFDGRVRPIRLSLSELNKLKITEVTGYRNLDSTCSKDSFFECLAKQFSNLSPQSVSNMEIYSFENSFEEPFSCNQTTRVCYPFSMPSVDNRIPVCSTVLEQSCYRKLIDELETEEQCKKPCNIREFKVLQQNLGSNLESDEPWLSPSDRVVRIELGLGLPLNTMDVRSVKNKKLKTVKTEHLIMSWMSLVGNVGGTLGLFVGFSFITTSEWLFTISKQIWKRMKAEL